MNTIVKLTQEELIQDINDMFKENDILEYEIDTEMGTGRCLVSILLRKKGMVDE